MDYHEYTEQFEGVHEGQKELMLEVAKYFQPELVAICTDHEVFHNPDYLARLVVATLTFTLMYYNEHGIPDTLRERADAVTNVLLTRTLRDSLLLEE